MLLPEIVLSTLFLLATPYGKHIATQRNGWLKILLTAV